MKRSRDFALRILLTAALFTRLGWVLTRSPDERALASLPDQREYMELGRNLLAGRALKFHDDRFDSDVFAYRTPGYPLLVAACGANVRAIRIVQSVIDTSTVLAAFLLARRWLSYDVSLIAAALVAFNPFLIFFTGLILSETLFIAMLVWGMALVPRAWIAGALILAASVLVRPSALFLGVLLTAFAALTNRSSGKTYHMRTLALRAIVASALTLLALVPWAMRNRSVVGEWVWTTTNSGITEFDGLHPGATGASDQRFVSEMPELSRLSEAERSRYLARLAREFAAQHPQGVLQLAIVKIARTWSPVPLSADYGGRHAYVIVGLLYSVPLDLLVIAGLVMSRALPGSVKTLLMLPAIYLTVAHAITVGSLRYRIPAEVPMAVVAASAVARHKTSA
jgi:hypothetical protein